MKKWTVATSLLLALAMTGCSLSSHASYPETEDSTLPQADPFVAVESQTLRESYYDGQEDPAFRLIQSGMHSRLISHWTEPNLGADLANPAWNVETFARYQILDRDLQAVDTGQDLYCCTFTADGERSGFAVLRYEEDPVYGGGLGQVGMAETPHLYDLQTHWDTVLPLLVETGLDLDTATATRVRLVDEAQNRADEVILFRDASGAHCVFSLDSLTVEGL